MPKLLVVCCDGTWDSPDELSDGTPTPTNVTRIALALATKDASGLEQRMYYHLGVGTSRWQRFIGGAFGFGVSRAVRDTYAFLVDNYEPGDKLYFFGFSRGAFTARSTAGFVRNCGVLRRENARLIDRAFAVYRNRTSTTHPRGVEATLFRQSYSHEPEIRFIGVWDTVGALGIPMTPSALAAIVNRSTRFHDTSLSSHVGAAFQALAIDEERGPFSPTLWTDVAEGQRVEQVWFTGVHRDVGGGYREHQLSDITFRWMMHRARECGLTFVDGCDQAVPVSTNPVPGDTALATALKVNPDPLAAPHNSRTGFYRLLWRHVRELDAADPTQYAASTAVEHCAARREYDSLNLAAYLDGPHQVLDTDS